MTEELSRFVEQWVHPDYPPQPFSSEDISKLEASLKTALPTDYRNAMIEIGQVNTSITLLDEIVDNEIDLYDLSELYSATDVLEETNRWREIGLPSNLIAIGSDCAGNKFCIKSSNQPNDTSGIFFWDHDFDEIELIAESFNEWIAMYNKTITAR